MSQSFVGDRLEEAIQRITPRDDATPRERQSILMENEARRQAYRLNPPQRDLDRIRAHRARVAARKNAGEIDSEEAGAMDRWLAVAEERAERAAVDEEALAEIRRRQAKAATAVEIEGWAA